MSLTTISFVTGEAEVTIGISYWSAAMSPTSLDQITLTGSQRRELTRLTRAGRTEQRLVTRAAIVLAAAAGQSNAQIARRLGVTEDTVRKWRRRWCVATYTHHG